MRFRRFFSTLALCLAATAAVTACGRGRADTNVPSPSHLHLSPASATEYSVILEDENGNDLPTFFHNGQTFIAGQQGLRYNVRVQNNTNRRVEAVIAVDGRDVVSGDLGDFRKQRGYIIEPFGTVRVEGFRQSMEQVAAFRFSTVESSYSGRRGNAQHSGVIGVAIFEERGPKKDENQPLAVAPPPFPNSNRGGGGGADFEDRSSVAGQAAPRDRAKTARRAPRSAPAPSEPSAGASADFAESEAAPLADSDDAGFAPAPQPQNELGTAYGESRASSVRETSFKRRAKRRPDAVLTIQYDTPRGLEARGVPLSGGFAPNPNPVAFPISQ